MKKVPTTEAEARECGAALFKRGLKPGAAPRGMDLALLDAVVEGWRAAREQAN